jgi:hypothetical protein
VTIPALPTNDQAEDAAASAMAHLLVEALARAADVTVLDLALDGGTFGIEGLVVACRELLRGPVAEDYSRQPGGYCMRAPTHPTLQLIARTGARLVEISYTVPTAFRAMVEASDAFQDLLATVSEEAQRG